MSAYDVLLRLAAGMLGGTGTIFAISAVLWVGAAFRSASSDDAKTTKRLNSMLLCSALSSALWIAAALVLHVGGLS